MSGVQAPPRPTTASRQGPGGGAGMAPVAPMGGALRPPTGMHLGAGAPLGAPGMGSIGGGGGGGGFRPTTGMMPGMGKGDMST